MKNLSLFFTSLILSSLILNANAANYTVPHITTHIMTNAKQYQTKFIHTSTTTFYYANLQTQQPYQNDIWLSVPQTFGFFVKTKKFNIYHDVIICLNKGNTCNTIQDKYCDFYLDPTGPGKPNVTVHHFNNAQCHYQISGFTESFYIN